MSLPIIRIPVGSSFLSNWALGSWPGFASQAWVAPVVEVVSWVSSSRETEVGFWKHVRERQAAGALAEPQHCAVGKEGGGAVR